MISADVLWLLQCFLSLRLVLMRTECTQRQMVSHFFHTLQADVHTHTLHSPLTFTIDLNQIEGRESMLGRHRITRVQSTNQKVTGTETPHRHDLS